MIPPTDGAGAALISVKGHHKSKILQAASTINSSSNLKINMNCERITQYEIWCRLLALTMFKNFILDVYENSIYDEPLFDISLLLE